MNKLSGSCIIRVVDWDRKNRRLIKRQTGRRRINTYPFILRVASNFTAARKDLDASTMRCDLLIVDPQTRTGNAKGAICIGSQGGVGLEFLRLVLENRWHTLAKTPILICTAMPKDSAVAQEIIKLGGKRIVWLAKPCKWKDISKVLIELFCR